MGSVGGGEGWVDLAVWVPALYRWWFFGRSENFASGQFNLFVRYNSFLKCMHGNPGPRYPDLELYLCFIGGCYPYRLFYTVRLYRLFLYRLFYTVGSIPSVSFFELAKKPMNN